MFIQKQKSKQQPRDLFERGLLPGQGSGKTQDAQLVLSIWGCQNECDMLKKRMEACHSIMGANLKELPIVTTGTISETKLVTIVLNFNKENKYPLVCTDTMVVGGLVAKSCPTLVDSLATPWTSSSLSGSSVHRILQVRILETDTINKWINKLAVDKRKLLQ